MISPYSNPNIESVNNVNGICNSAHWCWALQMIVEKWWEVILRQMQLPPSNSWGATWAQWQMQLPSCNRWGQHGPRDRCSCPHITDGGCEAQGQMQLPSYNRWGLYGPRDRCICPHITDGGPHGPSDRGSCLYITDGGRMGPVTDAAARI